LSKVNGPGVRFVIWVQGCSRGCAGCFNPSSHPLSGGFDISPEELAKEIPNCGIDGITVSGGEPFEQTLELKKLLALCKDRHLHTMVYTGFTYEELCCSNDRDVQDCLSVIDLLVDGPYEENVPPVLPWCGSGNQRILDLKNGKAGTGFPIGFPAENRDGEIIINGSGTIIVSGIFDSAFLQQE
jgi:anaerobic ribonucleoside-triphosphate reductase activating protein